MGGSFLERSDSNGSRIPDLGRDVRNEGRGKTENLSA